ncbi:hypothetical protein C7M84_022061 [Penaeus vannamei]|uniref:G domain-containing protein n=1 Tax=Penaeus vannamei TaxID=6689 RepID=A0A3R7NE30_PENVA|nr:hypothetical protein C7M84_022061 [Penaeus vannamei]
MAHNEQTKEEFRREISAITCLFYLPYHTSFCFYSNNTHTHTVAGQSASFPLLPSLHLSFCLTLLPSRLSSVFFLLSRHLSLHPSLPSLSLSSAKCSSSSGARRGAMSSSEVDLHALVEGRCVRAREEGGLAIYAPRTRLLRRDEARRTQVAAVGEWAAGEVRAVLLLGETGAGKTRALNAMLNVLFGVRFGDTFRLELPDQLAEGAPRSPVHSQTDYISAYLLYGGAGAPFRCHYLLVDTPGFGDTRGAEHRRSVTQRLRAFLTEEPSFDSLHCIGLVTKANENRVCSGQREVLAEFTALLGSDVAGVTHLLATFAVDDAPVEEVMRSAGLLYSHAFLFDNWPLYAAHGPALSPARRTSLELRWDCMAAEYRRFFAAVDSARPVSLTLTRDLLRERRELEATLGALRAQVRLAAQAASALRVEQRAQRQALRLAGQIEWKRDVRRVLRETYKVMKGFHAHNCPQCDRTCIFPLVLRAAARGRVRRERLHARPGRALRRRLPHHPQHRDGRGRGLPGEGAP